MGSEGEGRYCSEMARAAGATLIGTADPVDVWILLEYGGTWRGKALLDNDLPAAAKAWVAKAAREVATALGCNARLLFIRQPAREGMPPQLLVVRSGEQQRFVRQVELPDHDALAQVDIVALVRDGTGGRTIDVPLYLVCTNGQRDLCCARFGLPVYDQLAERHGASVWQVTHVGGHRYAPNLICLPEGLVYGFADLESAPGIVEATRRGEVVPGKLRGRSCLSAVAQVAELEARRHAGQYFLEAVRLAGETRLADSTWEVAFAVTGSGEVRVRVAALPPLQVQASCGDEGTKAVPVFAASIVPEVRAGAGMDGAG